MKPFTEVSLAQTDVSVVAHDATGTEDVMGPLRRERTHRSLDQRKQTEDVMNRFAEWTLSGLMIGMYVLLSIGMVTGITGGF
jgi:hypothetical protein